MTAPTANCDPRILDAAPVTGVVVAVGAETVGAVALTVEETEADAEVAIDIGPVISGMKIGKADHDEVSDEIAGADTVVLELEVVLVLRLDVLTPNMMVL
ncbi:MAG: hypothetical protein GOMPHAMPRED_002697 [Gomphillus americanus]|uniref:Uncharacterized protein n=1 Tax=Gomphillus americanus TaxID=1940652 RepID=A0A8H3IR56_9LECA|nr:MAG: hypothetical protein GOMPHAMPRED_002697 [Gomphillus americanus]